jgi:putative oxidoreductase
MISCLANFCEKKNHFLGKYIAPILLLTLRIMIASVFLKSGLTKFSNFDSAIFLFENEYNVPLLSPYVAACLALCFELGCSVLLIVGLATRLATLPLIGITLVIQFTVLENPMHFYWLAILATILTFGPGCLSLDKLVKRCVNKCTNK